MGAKNTFKPIELQTIDSSTLTASYQAINSGGIEAPISILRLKNSSDEDVTISFDGDTDHEFLASGDDVKYDFQANSNRSSYIAALFQGTVVYAKGSAGTGTVSVSGWRQPQL